MPRILATILLTVSVLGHANAADSVPDYPAEKISANTWVIHGSLGFPDAHNRGFVNNPSFTVTAAGVVLIDPGSSRAIGEMVLRQIAKVTEQPVTHVFTTHIHGDHWLGNGAIAAAFPAARFYAHPQMIEAAEGNGTQRWLDLMDRMTEGASKGTKPVVPSETLSDGQTLTVGGLSFRVYLGEHAHSRTDLMVEVVEDGVMVLGDIVSNQRMGLMDDGSFRGNIAACDRIRRAPATVFVPGHGPTGDAASTLKFCDYLKRLYEEVGPLAEEGLEDFEIKQALEPKFSEFSGWTDFDANFGRHVSLAKLEYESASF